MKVGAPWEDDTDIGPVINETAIDKIHSYTEIGNDEGAKLLTGGERVDGARRFYYRPTVFADVEPECASRRRRSSGRRRRSSPSTRSRTPSAPRTASATASRRRSSRVTSTRRSRRCATCRPGITYINAGTTGAEVHLPFGGTKDTGNGHREAGQAALDVFTEWKSIYVDYSGKLQQAQIDNLEAQALSSGPRADTNQEP